MILTPDNEYTAVLDACVLLPMPLCDTLLRLAEEPSLYRPLWSTNILEEVARNLAQKLKRTPEQCQRRVEAMRAAFPEAEVCVPPELLDAFECMPDPNDRHVLAAAVRGHAHVIVTQNVKHFPVECLERFDVLCHTADDFLIHQFHISPDQVLTKLDEQAANVNGDRIALTKLLAVMVPNFANLVLERSA
jgi:predicted nucleic acid-binding protein